MELEANTSWTASRRFAWYGWRVRRGRFAAPRPYVWLCERLRPILANGRTPLVLVAIVCAVGTGARAFHLGIPSASRPGQGYIFDEHYYVSAARVIVGIPTTRDEAYAGASPNGTDPNAEHPQLAKIAIAAGMKVLGDNTTGWRITAVLFGAAA